MKLKSAKRMQRPPLKVRMRGMFGSRFKAGSYSAVAGVIVIAIAVVVNMMAGALPSAYTQIDVTDQSLYTLSDQTRRIVASLDKDVNLYLLATTGNEDSTISKLLSRYGELSSHIQVSAVDPLEDPTFLKAYDLETSQLYANSVLVDCDGRWRLVSYADIYVTSYDMDYYSYSYTTTTDFDGENVLTNAIHYVTSDDLPRVYTLSGHGEEALTSTVTDMLAQDNLDSESLTLINLESVPEDADAIIINVPAGDISVDEAEMLINWLENGGRIVLITAYVEEGAMPNLMSVAEYMGMTAQTGLVLEEDSRMHVNRYPYYLLPNIESHEITDPLIEGGYYILTPLAQPIVESGSSGAEVSFLLSTSDTSFAKVEGMAIETMEKDEDDAMGPFNLAAASERNEAKMVWIAAVDFLNDSVNMTVSGANGDLFMNAVNWMCEQEQSISIRAKSLDTNTLTVTAAQSTRWSIIMIGLIPIALITTGVVVTIRRKKR